MEGYVNEAGIYLIQVLFSLYILAVLLRFMFQLVRADFYNPVSQVLVKITNPPLLPLRRIIPGLWGVDLASIVLLLFLQVLELFLVIGLKHSFLMAPLALSVLALAELVSLATYVFIFCMLIRIVLSWLQAGAYNPVIGLIVSLTEPLMRPARRLIPPISGLDLSPIAVFIALELVLILLVRPIQDLGKSLLF
ncbi:MAG: YggT family protein [Gammaproteobacteria bacterium]|nr:MAG: YggT family protein [Gammaproteobacteria bacterium]